VNSPARDTGNNAAPGMPRTDRSPAFRFAGPSVDMGAYEYGAITYHQRRIVDFDGDRLSDLVVYNAASGLWYVRQSTTGDSYSYGFGGAGYTPVVGDFDGDNKTDF